MEYLRFDKRVFSHPLAEKWQEERGLTVPSPVETEQFWIFKHETLPDNCCAYGVTAFKAMGAGPVQSTADQHVFKAGTQSDADPFEFVLSDESVDRMGDVIRVDGWQLKDFRQNPIALLGHDHSKVLGTWSKVRKEGKKLIGRLNFAKEGTSELIDTARKLTEQRILKAVSVGFIPLDGQPRDKENPWEGFEFTKASLFEVSLVAVPANPNALAVAKALSPSAAEQLFIRSDNLNGTGRIRGVGTQGRVADMKTPNLQAMRQRMKALGIN